MTNITIEVDDALARYIEDAARREHKSVSEWVRERVTREADRVAFLAELEANARKNGYPPGWITVFGTLADDDTFSVPVRTDCRDISALD